MTDKPKLPRSDARRRLRKLAELSLLIPLMGFAFFLTPLIDAFTSDGDAAATPIAIAGYIFGAWAFLIVATLIISRLLVAHVPSD